MNATPVLASLALCLSASTALAGVYDGDYALDHHAITGRAEVCVSADALAVCIPMEIALLLEDEQVTAQTIASLTADLVDALEVRTGHALRPRVEEAIFAAAERAYLAVAEDLGAGVDALPQEMTLRQGLYEENVLFAELTNDLGETWQGMGRIETSDGTFVLMGLMSGQLRPEEEVAGKGQMSMALDTEVEDSGVTVSIFGEGQVEFGLITL